MRALLASMAVLAALAAGAAQADVGLMELQGRGDDGPVTVFYPTAQAAKTVVRGPFHLQLAERAAPVPGNGRLMVLSHGSGGNAWTYTDLATQFVNAGFVVAVPLHRGDSAEGMSDMGPKSWKRRPIEISHAIDAVAAEPKLAPLLALDKVGMFGMSAGGHTALTLAGGRWSPSRLREHCETHLDDDFASCVGPVLELRGDVFDGMKKAVVRTANRWLLDDSRWYGYTDPRIAAVVAEVPYALDFDPASLAKPPVPLGLVRAGRDIWLPPAYHVDVVLGACKTCERVVDLPSAGHGSLLSPPPPADRLSGTVGRLLRDPPGFDRALVPQAHARIVAFFQQHLLP
jgi:predicted dienelactone hydrolase